MSDESCDKADPVVEHVVPSVKVVGLEKVMSSEPLRFLFNASKKWILSLWKGKTEQIENITILDKIIGRNDGFVLLVNCLDASMSVTFYAKLQYASMDTVLIHHLLKNMKCGPDRFHVTELFDGYSSPYHGVITEEVKDWRMASSLTSAETRELLNEKKKITTTMFLHTFLVELGRFGNIPNNRDNWGFVDGTDDSIPYPRMAMIDFSRSSYAKHKFRCMYNFYYFWEENLAYMWRKWEPVCGDIEDLQLFRNRTADLRRSLLRNIDIEVEIPHFPFLQSREAFVQVLQSACDDTALWLQETFPQAREPTEDNNENSNCNNDNNSNVSASAGAVDSAPDKIFQPFKHISRPCPIRFIHLRLIEEYESLVEEWNDSVAMLSKWLR